MNKKIIVGLSGGVDSSVALLLLKRAGWQPIGVTLKLPIWQDKENLLRENICCTAESIRLAKKICKKLDVPYYIFDVRKDFEEEVIDYFVSELRVGRTPNPCIICNRRLKFRKLFAFAKKIGANFIATGHYARIKKITNYQLRITNYQLLMAKDKNKDQTYNLAFLPQRWLKYIIFPLGEYTKSQVYRIAQDEGLDFLVKRRQSQDFCFVAGKSLSSFLEEKIGKKEGLIIDSKGRILGKHQGLHFYTIGQRKGLYLSGGPFFVKDFNLAKNLLIVTKDKRQISQRQILLSQYHFISSQTPSKKMRLQAKVRYRAPLGKATLSPSKEKKIKIVFDQAQSAVTPGQFCVFYLPTEASAKGGEQEVCLGGGVIN